MMMASSSGEDLVQGDNNLDRHVDDTTDPGLEALRL